MTRFRRSRYSALQQIQSNGSVVLGLGCLGVFVVAPSRLAQFASVTGDWWSWLGGAVVVAMSAALTSIGLYRRTDLLPAVGYGSAVAYLSVILTWYIGWNGDAVPALDGPRLELWVVFIPQILGSVLVMAGRLAPGLGIVGVTGVAGLWMTMAASGRIDWIDMVPAAWLLALTSLYQVITWAVVAAARRLGDEREAAVIEAVRRLRQGAQSSEQRRLDALVHDRLIAILVALRPGPVEPAGTKAIAGVLDEIAGWSSDLDSESVPVPAAELVQRLRLSLDEAGDDIEAVIDLATDTEYPADAVDAVVDAVGEAVRNVRRHAGPEATCAVVCQARDGAISAVVIDDGDGFDPHEVPPNRIGVALGIIERMRLLDGGHARVESEPGVGTRVELSWTAPGGTR